MKDAVTELTLFEGHFVGKLAQFEMSTMSIYSNVRSSGFKYLKFFVCLFVVVFLLNDKFIVLLLMIHSPRFFKV